MGGAMSVTSSPGAGSTFAFDIVADVPPVTPVTAAAAALHRPLLPPSSASASAESAVSSTEEKVAGDAALSSVIPVQRPLTSAVDRDSTTTNLHGLSADERAQLASAHLLHISAQTSLLHSWLRVCAFYGMSVHVCNSVSDARAFLLMRPPDDPGKPASSSSSFLSLAAAASSLSSLSEGVAVVPAVSAVLVDLDTAGVTEAACVEQLCTIAPTKLLYLYSSPKSQLALHATGTPRSGSVVSSPAVAYSSPPLSVPTRASDGDTAPSSVQSTPIADWPLAAELPMQLQQRCHSTIRRMLRKPAKTRALLHALLSLLAELLPQTVSAAATPSLPAARVTDENVLKLQPPLAAETEARVSSGASAASAAADSLSGSGTPTTAATVDPSLPNRVPSKSGKITSIAQRYPLRSSARDSTHGVNSRKQLAASVGCCCSHGLGCCRAGV
jgi:hypothetical protein